MKHKLRANDGPGLTKRYNQWAELNACDLVIGELVKLAEANTKRHYTDKGRNSVEEQISARRNLVYGDFEATNKYGEVFTTCICDAFGSENVRAVTEKTLDKTK